MSSNTLTPYDTGMRGEPKVWPTPSHSELAASEPIDRTLLEDRYGKVDFEDDESKTIATVWIEAVGDGYMLHLDGEGVAVMFHG